MYACMHVCIYVRIMYYVLFIMYYVLCIMYYEMYVLLGI